MSKEKRESKGFKRKFKHFKRYFRRRKTVILPILAVIIIVPLVFMFFQSKSNKNTATVNEASVKEEQKAATFEGQTMVCFGDSVTSGSGTTQFYPSVIAESTDLTVYNFAIEGTRLAGIPVSEEENKEKKDYYQAYNSLSFVELVNAITTNVYDTPDWGVKNEETLSKSASEKISTMKTLNWSEVDYITVCYGADDIRSYCAPLDDENDKLNVDTYLGALRSSVSKLKAHFPNTKIILMTPIYRELSPTEPNSDCYIVEYVESDNGIDEVNLPFTAWCDGVLSVAEEYDILGIDLYKATGFNRVNVEKYYKKEGSAFIEPNNAGHSVIGGIITDSLTNEYLNQDG